jgi:sarcosine dehydrogenase
MNLAFYRCKVSETLGGHRPIDRFVRLKTNFSLSLINLGPKSREILTLMSGYDFSNENFPPNSAAIIKIKDRSGEKYRVRALRVSFVGELGYELHIPKESCVKVYNILMRVGAAMGLKNAGYRSMYSLSSEKGL